jgi:hypothetical protein
VEADTYCAGFHVAEADDEHGVDFGLFGFLDFAVDFVGGEIRFDADHLGAEFADNLAGVGGEFFVVADG